MERKREAEKMEKGTQASEGLRFKGFKNSSELIIFGIRHLLEDARTL